MASTISLPELTNDTETILARALVGKQICALGIDGFGLYARSDQAKFFIVNDIEVETVANVDDYSNIFAVTKIYLRDYESAVIGHLVTDKNFEISFNKHLQDEFIPSHAWKWGNITEQGDHFVTIHFNLSELFVLP